ncbi:MAG: hypothetical protein JNK53_07155, partial [Phycisphaerae bacterium]|nr:hypothetical protein [Phycisphaerae bacterium]
MTGGHVPTGRDLDRMLAFVDGDLSVAEGDALLSELPHAERARLIAMRADSQALRAVRAPAAPEALHEAIMTSLERAELFAPASTGTRTTTGAHASRSGHAHPRPHQHAHADSGVIARPWAVRWRAPLSVAATLALAAGVTWVVWPRSAPLPSNSEIHGVSTSSVV